MGYLVRSKWYKVSNRASIRLEGHVNILMELCISCELLECDEFVTPLCRVCSRELQFEIDEELHADAVRFQRYLVAGLKLSSIELTKRLLEEGLCPYIHRTEAARRRGRMLLKEIEDNNRMFVEACLYAEVGSR